MSLVASKHIVLMNTLITILISILLIFGLIDLAITASSRTTAPHEQSHTSTTPQPDLTSIKIIDKSRWGGVPARNYTNLTSPVPLVVIKHTAGTFCSDFINCSKYLRSLQAWSMEVKNSSDIWYNFLIGGDGNIYIGRGWDVQNENTNNSIDICYMGNFMYDVPTRKMLTAGKSLLINGVARSYISMNYKLVNHNQTYATMSPGVNLFKEIVKWPNYYNGSFSNVDGCLEENT